MKTKYNIFTTLLLFAAMLFTACADELNQNEKETVEPEIESGLTDTVCFSSGTNEGTRTGMYSDGRFKWINVKKSSDSRLDSIVDKIFIIKDGTPIPSERMVVNENGTYADFFVQGQFGAPEYDILYAGSSTEEKPVTDPTSVTISAEQIQSTPNNSDHYGFSGDCGKAKAIQNERGKYGFTMEHQMAYLMFEPRMRVAGTKGWVRRIKITELDGKNIRGTFVLGAGGIDDSSITDGSNVITIVCGADVKAVDAGTIKSKEAKNNGFPLVCYQLGDEGYVAGDNYAQYLDENGKDNSRIYAVIRPGTWRLKFEYEIVSHAAYQQLAIHGFSEEHDQHLWDTDPMGYTEYVAKETGVFTYAKNTYYRLRHAFDAPEPEVAPERNYKFEEYYMWGAKRWFWYGVSSYPVNYDGYQSENAPEFTEDLSNTRWFFYKTKSVNRVSSANKPYTWTTDFTFESGKYCPEIPQEIGFKWKTGEGGALTANQASYYVVYGDAHYDDTTPWTLEKYHGYNGYDGNDTVMVCYGGIWLKKKDAIVRDEGITWPDRNDEGQTSNLAAPFRYDAASGQNLPAFEGKRYNLRYCAPWSNYRHTYTNYADYQLTGEFKKPWELDTSKSEDDYFFVPALGRIEYGHHITGDIPTFTLVGAQGFYWTRTPVRYNFGETSYYFNPDGTWTGHWNDTYDGYFNAFYLNIHHDYFALSWQQKSQYVKTGMRVATDGPDGMFK